MRKVIPDYQKKQTLLYVERRDPAELAGYGDLYLEEGRTADALEFYQVARYTPGLERLQEMATAAGDVMLSQQAMKALGRQIEPADWDRVGEQAFALGKYLFGLYAFEKSGNAAAAERVREAIQREANEQSSCQNVVIMMS